MMILHVTDVYAPRLGGIERQVADLAARQRAQGHEVVVLTSTRGRPEPDLHRVWSPVWPPSRTLADLRPDVVHCHSSVVSPLAWSLARASVAQGTPAVLTVHSMVARTGPSSLGLRAVARALAGAVVWSAVSEVAARPLRQVIAAPVHVLHNGIDPAAWHISDVGGRARPTVVSVMRLAARKRPMALLDTLAAVARRLDGDVPWEVVIAGSGPQQRAVTRAVGRLGLDGVVTLAGRLDRDGVVDLLARADLYVAPARLESFGIAALEARCAGVPVVAVRGTGVGEFVHDGVDGVLVGDDRQMVDAVADLLTDRGRLRGMANASTRMPVAQSWERAVERCTELYELAAWQTARSWATGVH
jgi:glycosyltransferase involved in cell wall biosynthesis